MKKVIIDTNCLLSFVTDRNAAQQEKVSKLFHDAAKLKAVILCPHHVISEFIFVLSSVYGSEAEKIHSILSDLIVMLGIVTTGEVSIKTILSLWPSLIPDYGDAVVAAICKDSKGTAVVTFDKKFRTAMKAAGIQTCEL